MLDGAAVVGLGQPRLAGLGVDAVEVAAGAGWARPAGVLVAAVLAYRRASFPVVVLAAAATTAVLRLCGVA